MIQKVFLSALPVCAFATIFIWTYSESVHAVMFKPPPKSSAPRQAKGGASRRRVDFLTPSGQQAPARNYGGGSRSNLSNTKEGTRKTKSVRAKTSSGDLFTPKAGNENPRSDVE